MLNLRNPEISYILVSASNLKSLSSYLYSKEYYLIEIKGYYEGIFEDSIIAFTNIDEVELKKDCKNILEFFEQDCIIAKFKNQTTATKIFRDGQEKPLGILLYNTDSKNKSYIHDGLSFSFVEQQLYYFPEKLEDFKVGMVVEFLNNNKWSEKRVQNPQDEFEKIYKLLIKYNKIRIPV